MILVKCMFLVLNSSSQTSFFLKIKAGCQAAFHAPSNSHFEAIEQVSNRLLLHCHSQPSSVVTCCLKHCGRMLLPCCCQSTWFVYHSRKDIQARWLWQKLWWFSPGKDLIADSYAQPRSKAKPTFGPASQAAPASALHSPPHQRSWLQQPGQQQSQGTSEQDAIEERRRSGQSASTSRQGDSRGRQEVPSCSKGSPRGPSPTSPFGSITMASGKRNRAAAKKCKEAHAVETPTTLMHATPDSKAAAAQHTGHSLNRHSTEAPAQASPEHWQTLGQQCHASNGPCKHSCASHAVVEAAGTAATHASEPCQQEPQIERYQAQQGAPGLAGGCAPSTPAPVLDSTQDRRDTSNALPTSVVPNAVFLLSERPSLADGEPTLLAVSDDPLDKAAIKSGRRRKKGRRHCKPGPSAFPQLPYERFLQLEHSAQDPAPHSSDSDLKPVLAPDAAWQTSAQTDILADAMQRRLQLQERRAGGGLGEGHEGPQQRLSQHGGYMQREAQERLPRRRTTRSMLRGTDTQTGTRLVQWPLLHCMEAVLLTEHNTDC